MRILINLPAKFIQIAVAPILKTKIRDIKRNLIIIIIGEKTDHLSFKVILTKIKLFSRIMVINKSRNPFILNLNYLTFGRFI